MQQDPAAATRSLPETQAEPAWTRGLDSGLRVEGLSEALEI